MPKKVLYHRKPGDKRQAEDFYATCPTAIPPLMQLLGWDDGVPRRIWENSCGQGHLSEALTMYGHNVLSTDLVDRGYGISGVDFLQPTMFDHEQFDGIIMNPPYKHALQFIKKSINIAPITCAFLRIAFLESRGRKPFFETNPPRYVAVFSERARSAKDGDFENIGAAVQCYAWYVWERGYTGDSVIRWL